MTTRSGVALEKMADRRDEQIDRVDFDYRRMTERLDLNLLLVLDALMQEGSVTRAAAKLGLGQPATSAALNRLRGLYGDVLFVRTPQGMVPTARAREIAAGLGDTLETLRSTLTPSASFDPTTAKREFKICGGDFFGIVVLPGLVPSLMREAPGIDLRCRFIEKDDVLGCLEAGDIDLALTVLPDLPKYFATAPLLDDTFVCLTRPEHPAVASGLTREVFCGLDHILVTERGDATGAVDRALAPLGLTRRIAVTVPQVLVVPMLLAQTDLVATTGRRAAGRIMATFPLHAHPVPVPVPAWRMDMVWSRRNDGDVGLAWLRNRIAAAAQSAPDIDFCRLKPLST